MRIRSGWKVQQLLDRPFLFFLLLDAINITDRESRPELSQLQLSLARRNARDIKSARKELIAR